ncbi:VIN3-like protein 1 [Nymphaea colorata]|nr:VIN3-like protein 1 [Nymphaea colorata]
MESYDKTCGEALQLESLSSGGLSTPEKSEHVQETSKGQDTIQGFLQSCTKKELVQTCTTKDKKISGISKHIPKALSNKIYKNHESRKSSSQPTSNGNQVALKKLQRKGDNPVRLPSVSDMLSDGNRASSWVCKNSACRATLSLDDTFCKRCSCCICHLFDDNKDPSLWFVCSSESNGGDSCGLSCHIECALQHQKAGIVDLGQLMQLDGSYCCPSCGKVAGIIGCWKKQLAIAKDARRVDVLCYRISLSYRLLDGTSRFRDLHDIVTDAKCKLETEVGSVNGMSARMARGIVSRLSVAADVQKLCAHAIEKAEAWLTSVSNSHPSLNENSLPAACRIQFEDVTSSSLVIILKDPSSGSSDSVHGYKLWYCMSREQKHQKEPICILPKSQRRLLISNLQPCTEYTFRIISFTEAGDLGHSEFKCFTKSVEIIHKQSDLLAAPENKSDSLGISGSSASAKRGSRTMNASAGFKVRDLGKILRVAWAKEHGCYDEFCDADEDCAEVDDGSGSMKQEIAEEPHTHSRGLDLNVVCVPDLNADLASPLDCSKDEGSSERIIEAEEDVLSHGRDKNAQAEYNDSDSHWLMRPVKEIPAIETHTRFRDKKMANGNEEAYDCDSTLINGSPLRFSAGPGYLDGNYEYCVKIIRWLERGGHIDKDFRMNFLTWFSLRSTEEERRVVNTFIQTLIDDPSSLAGQLVDSFLDIISNKRPRNGFCSKLWH